MSHHQSSSYERSSRWMWQISASCCWIWEAKSVASINCSCSSYHHCKIRKCLFFIVPLCSCLIIRGLFAVLHSLVLLLLPIIDEKAIFVYLVLQGKVEGKVFNAFIVVDLHLRGILIGLKVFDDIREPDWQTIIPATTRMQWCQDIIHFIGKELCFRGLTQRHFENVRWGGLWFLLDSRGVFNLPLLSPLFFHSYSNTSGEVLINRVWLIMKHVHSRMTKMTEMQCGCKPGSFAQGKLDFYVLCTLSVQWHKKTRESSSPKWEHEPDYG